MTMRTMKGCLLGYAGALLLCLPGGSVTAMPEQLCLRDCKPSGSYRAVRVRALMMHNNTETGEQTQRGDIYRREYHSFNYNEQHKTSDHLKYEICFNSAELLTEFNDRGLDASGIYFTQVRLDIDKHDDCYLKGEDSQHGWIGAPIRPGRAGCVYHQDHCAEVDAEN